MHGVNQISDKNSPFNLLKEQVLLHIGEECLPCLPAPDILLNGQSSLIYLGSLHLLLSCWVLAEKVVRDLIFILILILEVMTLLALQFLAIFCVELINGAAAEHPQNLWVYHVQLGVWLEDSLRDDNMRFRDTIWHGSEGCIMMGVHLIHLLEFKHLIVLLHELLLRLVIFGRYLTENWVRVGLD